MTLRPLKPAPAALRDLARLGAAGGTALARRARLALAGAARPRTLELERDRVALLFFEDVERDQLVRGDRHLRRTARRLYHALTVGQSVTGFEMAFRLLRRALEAEGWTVIVNDRALARRNPRHPIGIAGYPHVLEGWDLPNPAVLGPGLLDHPSVAPELMRDPRFKAYLVPGDWVKAIFAPYYGERCVSWFAGIDTEAWPDTSGHPKDLDLLVYDKIHWDRTRMLRELIDPALAEAARRGLSVQVLRYGAYAPHEYCAALRRARGLLFLSEHETQGIAYQEALASGVPVLAWNQGLWIDPHRAGDRRVPVIASSVPFFGPECGETFADAGTFAAALDRFLARRDAYRPRQFVEERLSLGASARAWLTAYRAAATGGAGSA